ncbi:MAG: uroporphyrinogen decarboxylase family protein [Promethearchaeota archaeon]
MEGEPNDFIKCLSKEVTTNIPIYCTGYPESDFIIRYRKKYNIKTNEEKDLLLNGKNYSTIKKIGFDAISIWDYRRGKGGYELDKGIRVDSWGRIYRDNWYLWEGVFKDADTINNWTHLRLPKKSKLDRLKKFLKRCRGHFQPVMSLPGLFEKTWQSMGYFHFAKSLRKHQEFLKEVVTFFTNYLKNLVKLLQNCGASVFLIADDCAYKNRLFIPNETWRELFYEEYQEIINLIHQKNHKVIIHSDGDIMDIVHIFIELNFDAIQSLEPNAGVDIFSLFKRYPGSITFIGNLDMGMLTFAEPIKIYKYVSKLIKMAKKTQNFLVISPTQQISSLVPPRNVKALIEAVQNF